MSAESYSWDSRIAFVVRYMYGELWTILIAPHIHCCININQFVIYWRSNSRVSYIFHSSLHNRPPHKSKNLLFTTYLTLFWLFIVERFSCFLSSYVSISLQTRKISFSLFGRRLLVKKRILRLDHSKLFSSMVFTLKMSGNWVETTFILCIIHHFLFLRT